MEKLGFGLDDFENVETRRAHLRTKHGYEFLVKLYNAVDRSHFGCSNWGALILHLVMATFIMQSVAFLLATS